MDSSVCSYHVLSADNGHCFASSNYTFPEHSENPAQAPKNNGASALASGAGSRPVSQPAPEAITCLWEESQEGGLDPWGFKVKGERLRGNGGCCLPTEIAAGSGEASLCLLRGNHASRSCLGKAASDSNSKLSQ